MCKRVREQNTRRPAHVPDWLGESVVSATVCELLYARHAVCARACAGVRARVCVHVHDMFSCVSVSVCERQCA